MSRASTNFPSQRDSTVRIRTSRTDAAHRPPRRIGLRIARHFALPVTSHCPSLRIARHFALPVTSHYPSLRITRHFALPVTSHYPSLRITRHFALPVTSHRTSHCPSLRIARHAVLRPPSARRQFCSQIQHAKSAIDHSDRFPLRSTNPGGGWLLGGFIRTVYYQSGSDERLTSGSFRCHVTVRPLRCIQVRICDSRPRGPGCCNERSVGNPTCPPRGIRLITTSADTLDSAGSNVDKGTMGSCSATTSNVGQAT